jgi:hypothetical protein
MPVADLCRQLAIADAMIPRRLGDDAPVADQPHRLRIELPTVTSPYHAIHPVPT